MTRAERRKAQREKAKAGSAKRVYITSPDGEWVDCMGDPWTLSRRGEAREVIDFFETILWTLRGMPVKTGEDAERSLELVRTLRDADTVVEMRQADYDWMMRQLQDNAHTVWNAPDSALLRETIKAQTSTREPTTEEIG